MVITHNPLLELKQLGQVVWLDSIRRGQILSGDLKHLIETDGLTGETANPSIFEKAITGSTDYDDAIREMSEGRTALEIYETLAIQDVQMAADVFRPVYEQTQGADGFVSLELSPKLAYDTQGSIAEAQRFFAALNRPNVLIKIPGTKEGMPAIEECLYQGININITLLFARAAYQDVAWAYIRALERRAAEGKPIDRVASVASFFVSRIDTLADKLIGIKLNSTTDSVRVAELKALQGKVAIANAQLAYQSFKEIFSDPRFVSLEKQGARVQRPLWASTSTKDPQLSDILYVETLIGPDTINTLPLETINAYRDHGHPRITIDKDLAGARQTLQNLDTVGLNLDAITQQVLDEGVEKFDVALDNLLRSIEAKRTAHTVAATMR
jgi:transaldolase